MCESGGMHIDFILKYLFGMLHNLILVPFNYLDMDEQDSEQDSVENYY